jgi:hypothetical protein
MRATIYSLLMLLTVAWIAGCDTGSTGTKTSSGIGGAADAKGSDAGGKMKVDKKPGSAGPAGGADN